MSSQSEAGRSAQTRLAALDGLRAVAALYVLLYHYTFCWGPAGRCDNLLAYGDQLSFIPLISVGFLGVQLFFIISGFVILLTLERCATLYEFLVRRAIRLWPPIVVFATFTFLFTQAFGPEILKVGFVEYVLSMLLIPPAHIGKMLGASGWSWVDYVYWTLFVEIRFYVLAGALFFIDRKNFARNWLILEVALLVATLGAAAAGIGAVAKLTDLLIEPHIAFFSIGLAAYYAYTDRRTFWVNALVAVGCLHGAWIIAGMIGDSQRQNIELLLVYAGMLTFFYFFAWRRYDMRPLTWRPVASTGRVSYGIYLVHQNLGLSLLSLPFFGWGYGLSVVGVLGCAALAIGLAHLSHRFVEVPSQEYFRSRLLAKFRKDGTRASAGAGEPTKTAG